MVKGIIITLTIIVVLLAIVGIFIGNYFYNIALNPKADRSKIFGATHNQIPSGEKEERDKKIKELKDWYESVNYDEEVYITSDDGLKLNATKITQESPSNKYAVLCHGYTGSNAEMVAFSRKFYGMGYNTLMPNARGHGKSEGDYIGMGWDERLDIIKWIDGIIATDPDAEIILLGVSMGGATVMMVSGEDLPVNVKAIVEDCGYTSAYEEFSYQIKQLFNLPPFPVMNFASLVSKVRAGYWIGEASAIKQVAKSKTPILFIHGSNDTFVPSYMLNEVYNAATCEKEKLVIDGAGHGQASSTNNELYWQTVSSFLGNYVS